MLSDDIERVRRALESFYSKKGEVWVSFGRIKTALEELGTTPNKPKTTCEHEKVAEPPNTLGEVDYVKEIMYLNEKVSYYETRITDMSAFMLRYQEITDQ